MFQSKKRQPKDTFLGQIKQTNEILVLFLVKLEIMKKFSKYPWSSFN